MNESLSVNRFDSFKYNQNVYVTVSACDVPKSLEHVIIYPCTLRILPEILPSNYSAVHSSFALVTTTDEEGERSFQNYSSIVFLYDFLVLLIVHKTCTIQSIFLSAVLIETSHFSSKW